MRQRRSTGAITRTEPHVRTTRTRAFGPGLLAILILAASTRVAAHDPGLSALDVRVGASAIVATMSLAEVDARALDASGAIEISFEDVPLVGTLGPIEPDPSGGRRLKWRFRGVSEGRLTVTSHVPGRLARGHRQLLVVRGQDGTLQAEQMIDAATSTVVVHIGRNATTTDTARRFFALGLHHIVTGYDHLLFLTGMLLVVKRLRDAAAIVTAFTAAHAVALGAAAVGAISVPPQVIEPLIAASVIWVGVENLVRRNVTGRWLPAFGFGLVHGLAFAGALSELDMATSGESLILRLASFNAGIEAGQLALSLVVVPMLGSVRRWPGFALRARYAGSVCVVLAGSYWLMERFSAF